MNQIFLPSPTEVGTRNRTPAHAVAEPPADMTIDLAWRGLAEPVFERSRKAALSLLQRWSIRTRLTLLGGAVVGALCLLFATAVLLGVHRLATDYLAEQLAVAGNQVAYSVEQGKTRTIVPQPPVRHVQVVDHKGTVVLASQDLQGNPAIASFRAQGAAGRAGFVACHKVFRTSECDIVAAVPVYHRGENWTVYTATPAIPIYVHPWLVASLFGGALLLTGAISYAGSRLVEKSLQPVNAIRTKLDKIKDGDLSRRVPVPPAQDEIHRLAQSVNHTLARLEQSFKRQRRFSSDASHELLTPLAAMRAQVEDAMLAPEETDVPALGNALLPNLERLQAIATDLLTLSRLEAMTHFTGEPVDLGGLITTELKDPPRQKEIIRHLSPHVLVSGDMRALGRVTASLVDNAERHAAHTITVTVRGEPGEPGDPRLRNGIAVLEVLDDGPGIAPDQREVVFQPFTRLDTARSRDAGGAGLGLAIARQIVENHGGHLTIEDSHQGARFVLTLPLDQPNDRDLFDLDATR